VECPRMAPERTQVTGWLRPRKGYRPLSWRAGEASAMRCPKTWSQSRRLLYTAESWGAKMEIPVETTAGVQILGICF